MNQFTATAPSLPQAAIRTLRALREAPGLKEEALRREHKIAEHDIEVADFLRIIHLQADRAEAFREFVSGGFAQDVLDTLRHHYGDRKEISICEIGAGDGFLSAALHRAGYTNLDVLEPSGEMISGTGYLRELNEFSGLRIFNDLDAWYSDAKTYDLIVTNACIHHFENPVVAAAQIRQKVNDNALWLAFAEYFAADYEETLSQLNRHRHAILYNLYEWPYSATLYKAMLEAGGFDRLSIAAAIPYGKRSLSPFLRAWRAVWRLFVALKLDAFAYGAFVFLIKLFARPSLPRATAFYMAFRARPVRWDHVAGGYAARGQNDRRMLPGWRPIGA
jgi:hypothetical protein